MDVWSPDCRGNVPEENATSDLRPCDFGKVRSPRRVCRFSRNPPVGGDLLVAVQMN